MEGAYHPFFSIMIGGFKTIVWKEHQKELFFAIEEAIGGRDLEYPATLNIAMQGEIRTIKVPTYHPIS